MAAARQRSWWRTKTANRASSTPRLTTVFPDANAPSPIISACMPRLRNPDLARSRGKAWGDRLQDFAAFGSQAIEQRVRVAVAVGGRAPGDAVAVDDDASLARSGAWVRAVRQAVHKQERIAPVQMDFYRPFQFFHRLTLPKR